MCLFKLLLCYSMYFFTFMKFKWKALISTEYVADFMTYSLNTYFITPSSQSVHYTVMFKVSLDFMEYLLTYILLKLLNITYFHF